MNSPMTKALSISDLRVFLKNDFAKPLASQMVEMGTNVAFLGENGSGKTSLIEALVGLRKYRGTATVLRSNSSNISDDDKRRLGVQFQSPAFDENYSVGDLVRFHQSVYPRTIDQMRQVFGVDELLTQQFEKLSTGQKRRVSLFLTFGHDPKLIFLDEPTAGLDAEYKGRFQELLWTKAKEPDSTVVVSTHDNDEASIADESWLMHRGSMRVAGAPRDLVSDLLAEYSYSIGFESEHSLKKFLKSIEKRECKSRLDTDARTVTVFEDKGFQKEIADILAQETVCHLAIRPTNISDVIKIEAGEHAQ